MGGAGSVLSSGRWSISFSSAFSRLSNAARISSALMLLDAAATSAVSWALSGRCQARGKR